MKDIEGSLSLWIRYEIKKEGELLYASKPKLSDSFVIGYIKMLAMKMAGLDDTSLTDTGGTSRSIDTNTDLQITAGSGDSTYGIVVGTGTTAVALADSKLVTQIAHGSGASQLQYGAGVVNLPSSTATTTTMTSTRDFTNASGATITIEEVGIYTKQVQGFIICIVRDLETISLTNGALLTLNYDWQTTT